MRWRCGLVALAALALGACSSSGPGAGGPTIALLVPDAASGRYVKRLCGACRVAYANAAGDAARQQQQAEDALAQGADVLVLDPVDGAAAAPIVDKAHAAGVPVISYDALVRNARPDYYVAIDDASAARAQARSLLDRLPAGGGIVMLNGAANDGNATTLKVAAHSVLDGSGHRILREYDTPGWSARAARSEIDDAIARLGTNGFAGIYAASGAIGAGATAALRANGIAPAAIAVSTPAPRPTAALARRAAEWAVALARGARPDGANATVDNGTTDVPAFLIAVRPG